MPAPFSILTLDLHNTIYDEVAEYGLALEEAVNFWREKAEQYGRPLYRETLHKELAAAHKRLGSDWDGEVWRYMPSLLRLGLNDADFDRAMKESESLRRKKSLQLTVSGIYEGVKETLVELKGRGVSVYVITEASADAGMRAIQWLKLAGVVDGVYTYPSRNPPPQLRDTYNKVFPDAVKGEHLRKPNPLLLAVVALDVAIHKGAVPSGTALGELFSTSVDETLTIPELTMSTSVQTDAGTRLVLKETTYKAVLREVLDGMLFVGDSKFKDGFLARNAGIAFGYAAYGKKIKDRERESHRKGLDIMYATTGWEKEVLKLTQEAGASETVSKLRPDYVFENSLAEGLRLFG